MRARIPHRTGIATMRRLELIAAILLIHTAASISMAQGPGPGGFGGPPAMMGPRSGGGPVGSTAEFLLARTGELKLTDAQVVRLAAIARRADDRRRALAVQLDSLRPAAGAGAPTVRRDSAARAERARVETRMRPAFQRYREQEHADLRDAIAVLTADQQATAWELVVTRGAAGPGRAGGARMGGSAPRREQFGPRPGGDRRDDRGGTSPTSGSLPLEP